MVKKLNGVEVSDANKSLRIDISQDDVKNGKPLDPQNCAAAECIKRTLGADDVYIHRGVCYIKRKGAKRYTRYATSSGLRLETIIFDRGGAFMPGYYDLEPVPVRMIAPKPKSPSKGRSPKEATLAVRRRSIPGVRRSARAAAETEE